MNVTWRFSALDSWFFRESRPFDNVGATPLGSVFPPSPVTLAGAIRTAVGEHNCLDWNRFADADAVLAAPLQHGGRLGDLQILGVYLSRLHQGQWQRLYPTPANLVKTRDDGIRDDGASDYALRFLRIGKPLRCDLGHVRLAVAPPGDDGKPMRDLKALSGHWLTATGFAQVLDGGSPDSQALLPDSALFCRENRLGIARNNQTRCNENGLLYQTQHIRPHADLAIEVDVVGLDAGSYPETGIVRLGGEGRGAAFTTQATPASAALPCASQQDDGCGIKLILLSPLAVAQAKDYAPLPGFTKTTKNGNSVWIGSIDGIALTLHSALIGKTLREGGWDIRAKQPKPVRSLLPAGSVFYCTVDDGDAATALRQLHGQRLASSDYDKALGRGLLAACPWYRDESL